MLNKLDPNLLSSISILDDNKKIKCLVRYENIDYIKNFLSKNNFSGYKNFPFIKASTSSENKRTLEEFTWAYMGTLA